MPGATALQQRGAAVLADWVVSCVQEKQYAHDIRTKIGCVESLIPLSEGGSTCVVCVDGQWCGGGGGGGRR